MFLRHHEPTAPRAVEGLLVFLASFALVAGLNADLVSLPPVWDAAPGVFAPAIYLYESGFDFKALLAEPGYMAGGPHVHTFSLMTLLTAAGFWVTNGSAAAIPLLHGMQFTFAGLALAATYLIARITHGYAASALAAGLVLLFPIFRVQTGYLYTEVLGAALVTLALYAWVRGRQRWAIVAMLLACADKSLGLPIAAALAILIVLDRRLSVPARLVHAAALMLPTGLLELARWVYRPADAASLEAGLASWDSLWSRLETVPDLYALLGIAAVWFIVQLWTVGKRDVALVGEISARTAAGDQERLTVGLAAFICAFLVFIMFAIQHLKLFIPLTRYYVWIIPLLVIVLLDTLWRSSAWATSVSKLSPSLRATRHTVHAVMVALIIVAGQNGHGALYPSIDGQRKFSVAERSLEYLKYYDVQHYGVASAAAYSGRLPLFVTRTEYYMLSSPLMGYVTSGPQDLRFILQPPYDAGRLDDYPADFLVLDAFSNRLHGQGAVASVLSEARKDSRYEVRVVDSRSNGPYRVKLYRIRVISAPLVIPDPAASAGSAVP